MQWIITAGLTMLITLEKAFLHNLPTYNHHVTFKDIRVEVSWCSCSTLNCTAHFKYESHTETN